MDLISLATSESCSRPAPVFLVDIWEVGNISRGKSQRMETWTGKSRCEVEREYFIQPKILSTIVNKETGHRSVQWQQSQA